MLGTDVPLPLVLGDKVGLAAKYSEWAREGAAIVRMGAHIDMALRGLRGPPLFLL